MAPKQLREFYFTRQKQMYAKELAAALANKTLPWREFPQMTDEEVRTHLTKIKGIGIWTADVYLMHALQRSDLIPLGDVALVNSLREVKNLPVQISKQEMLAIAKSWRLHRTIGTFILWHACRSKKMFNVRLDRAVLLTNPGVVQCMLPVLPTLVAILN